MDVDAEVDRESLVLRHLAWARNQARRFRGRGVSDEDLEGEAYVALLVASREYEPAKYPNASFRSYAWTVIRTHLGAALEKAPTFRMPRRLERAAARCRQAEAALIAAGDHRPTPDAIAAETGLDVETVREALSVSVAPASVESFGVMPEVADPDQERLLRVVDEVLDACTDLGRQVLTLCRVEDLSIGQAARVLGVPLKLARKAHREACLTVADEMHRRGWTEQSWAAAIA